jgi:hypothetical protein
MSQACVVCGQEFPEEDMVFGPDPFAEEIHGDSTEVWECDECNHESYMDI